MYAILSTISAGTIWIDLAVKILVGILLIGIGVVVKEKGIFRRIKER
jgi:hypothetical protein